MPENVSASIKYFVKALSSEKTRIAYSYQIVQKPLLQIDSEIAPKKIEKSRQIWQNPVSI